MKLKTKYIAYVYSSVLDRTALLFLGALEADALAEGIAVRVLFVTRLIRGTNEGEGIVLASSLTRNTSSL